MAGSRLTGASRARVTVEARTLRLEGGEVPYTLRRSARRSFALQVSDLGGVRVAVPLRADERDIASFLADHADWLVGKLAAQARLAVTVFDPCDGATLPVFGEPCRLRRGVDAARRIRWRGGADGVEELVLPSHATPHVALEKALRARALPWFRERVVEYAHRLGVPTPRVALSSARTRWGSCSTRSGIRLHWRLIHLPPALIDYVVAHEVAHLIEMNHSPRFWAVVASLCPDWRESRRALREAGRALPVIGPGAADAVLNED